MLVTGSGYVGPTNNTASSCGRNPFAGRHNSHTTGEGGRGFLTGIQRSFSGSPPRCEVQQFTEMAGRQQEMAGRQQEMAGRQQEMAGRQQEMAGRQQEMAGRQ